MGDKMEPNRMMVLVSMMITMIIFMWQVWQLTEFCYKVLARDMSTCFGQENYSLDRQNKAILQNVILLKHLLQNFYELKTSLC